MGVAYERLSKTIKETNSAPMFDPRGALDRAKALMGVLTGRL